MVQVDCSLDGCVRVRAPGQNGLAPGHANVVVQLPCSIRDILGEYICNAVSESALCQLRCVLSESALTHYGMSHQHCQVEALQM